MNTLIRLATILLANTSALAANAPDLDWLAGAWCGGDANASAEEHWLPQRGGLMLGFNRTVTASRTAFEFIRIEFTDDAVHYIAQPAGGPPTRFDLTEATPTSVTFANPQHDYPKRIRYIRSGDALTARIDAGRDDASAQEFRWTRCEPAPNL